MSRAFVNEDAGDRPSSRRFTLPSREDPAFDAAAARVILDAARDGDTGSAEEATGLLLGGTAPAPACGAHSRIRSLRAR